MGKVHQALHKSGAGFEEPAVPTDVPADDSHSPAPEPPETGFFKTPAPASRPPQEEPPAASVRPERQGRDEPSTVAGWDERLLSAIGSASEVSEEFRRLRTQILHPAGDKDPPRTILVVSAAPAEGKTLMTAGLAITLAQGVEEHALAIDCDLRQPSLAAMFGLDNRQGLADHLSHGVDMGRLIRKTELTKLSLLPAGPPPANPAELLGSERLEMMVNEVSRRYPDRYVIFDSPPLKIAAETAILAKLVDGVVLVVREGRSRRDDVAELIATIGPEKIFGVVFNAYQSTPLEQRLTGSYGSNYYYAPSLGNDR